MMDNREQAIASDGLEISQAQEHITWLKQQSNNTIDYALKELEVELQERDSAYIKSMQSELLT